LPLSNGAMKPFAQRRSLSLLQMMHSSSRPTTEYFDYLLGRNQMEETVDQPSIIIGDGRVGTMLREFGERRSFEDILIRRGDPIPADLPGPIYICTRNDDLESVIAQVPEEKRQDLVFMQNGQLEPLRQKYGLYDTTQACLWFALTRKGGKPLDGITSECPEGLTCVSGKWAGALSMRLRTGNLACEVVGERDLRRNMFEKLVWISAFMLVGSVHGGKTVGEVEKEHNEEVCDLIRELATMIRFTMSVALKTGLEERLCAYSRRVEFFPTAMKEFEWRNGWFYRYTKLAQKNGFPDATPMHTEYLRYGRENGLFTFDEIEV